MTTTQHTRKRTLSILLTLTMLLALLPAVSIPARAADGYIDYSTLGNFYTKLQTIVTSGSGTLMLAGDVDGAALPAPTLITVPEGGATVTIRSNSPVTLKPIGASNRHMVFSIQSGATLTLIFENVILDGNVIGDGIANPNDGGGIEALDGGALVLGGAVIQNCYSDVNVGGGVYAEGGVTVTDSRFEGNRADMLGGGLCAYGDVTVTDSIFRGNSTASYNGGGVYVDGKVTVSGSVFEDNQSEHGGGISARGSVLIQADSLFSGNVAGQAGGAVHSISDVKVANSTLRGNTSRVIGGGVFTNGKLEIEDSLLTGNSAARTGGAVQLNENAGKSLKVRNSQFIENEAGTHGGAVWYAPDSLPLLDIGTDVVFEGNLASVGYEIDNSVRGTPPYDAWEGIPASAPFAHIANNYDLLYEPVATDETVYTLSFYRNDGDDTVGLHARLELKDGWESEFPSDPTRVGYRFDGWNDEPDGSGDVITSSSAPAITTENLKVYAQWTPYLTVQAGTGGTVDTTVNGYYAKGDTISLTATASGGYRFDGWTSSGGSFGNEDSETTTFIMPDEPVTVTANFARTGSGGGSSSSTYTVRFDSQGGSSVSSQSIARNGKVTEPTNPTRNGYTFTGWYTSSALTTEYNFNSAVTGGFTLYAGWAAIGEVPEPEPDYDHPAYIEGYPDGTFRPDGTLTRAEAAALLYNLIDSNITAQSYVADFSDVQGGAWHYDAVMELARRGIINGYSDGSFKPNATISRAEFVTMALRFAGINASGGSSFTDVSAEHWASGAISAAVGAGYVNGYADGTFKPDNTVTRAEAVTILNRVIKCDGVSDGATFSDVPTSHWAFADISVAATGHNHE